MSENGDVRMADAEEQQRQEDEAQGTPPDGAATQRAIEVSVLGRNVIVVRRQARTAVVLKAHYCSRVLEQAHPQRMLQEVIVAQLHPELRSALPEYQIAWSYDPQLKPTAMNARRVMTQQQTVAELQQQLATGGCSCAIFEDRYKAPVAEIVEQHCPAASGTRHVLTTDLSIVANTQLRELLAQGLNHIPLRTADVHGIIEMQQHVADQFYDMILAPTAAALGVRLQPNGREIIGRGVAAWTAEQLGRTGDRGMTSAGAAAVTFWQHGGSAEPDSTSAALANLQRSLHICEVDKAASTPCLICPQYAQLLVMLRLSSSEDFELTDRDITAVQAVLKADLASIHPLLPQAVEGDRLPIMRVAFKAHKNSFRFLTNTAGSLLSNLNGLTQGLTSCILQEVTAALGQLNTTIRGMTGTQTQTCIVVPNAQHVAVNMPDRILTDMCADITKCFENIPTHPQQADSLPAALGWAVRKAFSFREAQTGRPQVLTVAYRRGVPSVCWQHKPAGNISSNLDGTRLYLHSEAVAALLTTVVTNAYVTAAGLTYRQSRGIPMGADYSPDVCNLYFMKYESQAVTRMQALAGTPELSRQLLSEWKYCFRLMDDMRFVNAPTLAGFVRDPQGAGDSSAIGWIYPACVGIDITYDVTAAGAGRVQETQYLDMLTHIHPDGSYDVEVYDKQCKLPITPINYISLHSNRPVNNSYKLILGQASRIAAICSTPQLAAKHIRAVVGKLSNRGFKADRLLRVLHEWAQGNSTIPGKPFSMIDVTALLLHRRKYWRKWRP
jgi:hypothetical protein